MRSARDPVTVGAPLRACECRALARPGRSPPGRPTRDRPAATLQNHLLWSDCDIPPGPKPLAVPNSHYRMGGSPPPPAQRFSHACAHCRGAHVRPAAGGGGGLWLWCAGFYCLEPAGIAPACFAGHASRPEFRSEAGGGWLEARSPNLGTHVARSNILMHRTLAKRRYSANRPPLPRRPTRAHARRRQPLAGP